MDSKMILRELQLQSSIIAGDLEDIKTLAKEGVNLNTPCLVGSMLMKAANIQRWNVVELLIDLGADVNKSHGYFEWKLLHYAAKNSWISVVQKIVDKKFNLDVETRSCETPLMIAAQCNHIEVVKLLVNGGADVNYCNNRMFRAFHFASYKGNKEIVQFLVENKADINVQEFRGQTALHLVFSKHTGIEMIGFLIKIGVDCNIQNNEGISAFNLLTHRGYMGEIKLAIEKGAYVQAYDNSRFLAEPLLISEVLQKVNYCSQAIINKYNNKDLPDLYKEQVASSRLPVIEKMKMQFKGEVEIQIERSVNLAIENKGYCDLMKVQPFILSKLCVESFLSYVRREKESSVSTETIPSPSCSASGLERFYRRVPSQKRSFEKM